MQNQSQHPTDPNGIFNIYKPLGKTSHDVVARVRRITGQRRVGHCGTLDPAAEGVLLICVGSATRVAEYLMAGRKRYLAMVMLGHTSTTDDAEGVVVRRVESTDVSRAQVEAALAEFRGRIMQVPPSYSAVKRGGKPAYQLARAGVKVDLEPREVEIYDARVVAWRPPNLRMTIECSSGTYIRSLARDLGARLGCGAYLSHLVRTSSGRFTVNQSVQLEQLAAAFVEGGWQKLLYPVDEALRDMEALVVDEDGVRLITTGRPWCPTEVEPRPAPGSLRRVYTQPGEFIAIAEFDPAVGGWRPHKVLREG